MNKNELHKHLEDAYKKFEHRSLYEYDLDLSLLIDNNINISSNIFRFREKKEDRT